MEFKIGDRVVVNAGVQVGAVKSDGSLCGTVCDITLNCGGVGIADVAVDFGENIGGHECYGICEWGHGWYMLPHEISLEGEENESEDHPEPDLSALSAFLN